MGKIFSEVVGSSGGRGLAGKSESLASDSEEDNLDPLLMPALSNSYSATLIYYHYHASYYNGLPWPRQAGTTSYLETKMQVALLLIRAKMG